MRGTALIFILAAAIRANPLLQGTPDVAADSVLHTPKVTGKLFGRTTGCAAQPAGYGPVPKPDTAKAFLAFDKFSSAALKAATPPGYVNTFKNLQASNNADGYLGYSTLKSYDTLACSKACDARDGCSAFNIYFERDPCYDPGPSCPNPESTTNIKCVFWGGPVTSDNANNAGQYRTNFQVVIAGSNGYVNRIIARPSGYTQPTYLGDAAINAPLDCNGADTYMGYKLFTDGVAFDAARCTAACTAQNAYNTARPPADGSAVPLCRFVNTYLLRKNGVSQGQYCAMYTRAWDASYATNRGQYRGADLYTIAHSYVFSNVTDKGVCRKSAV